MYQEACDASERAFTELLEGEAAEAAAKKKKAAKKAKRAAAGVEKVLLLQQQQQQQQQQKGEEEGGRDQQQQHIGENGKVQHDDDDDNVGVAIQSVIHNDAAAPVAGERGDTTSVNASVDTSVRKNGGTAHITHKTAAQPTPANDNKPQPQEHDESIHAADNDDDDGASTLASMVAHASKARSTASSKTTDITATTHASAQPIKPPKRDTSPAPTSTSKTTSTSTTPAPRVAVAIKPIHRGQTSGQPSSGQPHSGAEGVHGRPAVVSVTRTPSGGGVVVVSKAGVRGKPEVWWWWCVCGGEV